MSQKRPEELGAWPLGGFILICILLSSQVLSSSAQKGNQAAIRSQVTFLYYENLGEAARFYEQALGLEATFSLPWVKIFQVTEGASVGLVDIRRGHFKTAQTKGVMFSLVTDDVDAWYARLKGLDAKLLSSPKDSRETGIRAFLFQDPGGYTLEFFQWLER
ncbi:MAG: VOC family protein [Acidobacteriota bacterium]